MTMTTCHPMYSGRERYIVHSVLDYWVGVSEGTPVELAGTGAVPATQKGASEQRRVRGKTVAGCMAGSDDGLGAVPAPSAAEVVSGVRSAVARAARPAWLRASIVVRLVAIVVVVCFAWVFPAVAPLMPFNDVTVG